MDLIQSSTCRQPDTFHSCFVIFSNFSTFYTCRHVKSGLMLRMKWVRVNIVKPSYHTWEQNTKTIDGQIKKIFAGINLPRNEVNLPSNGRNQFLGKGKHPRMELKMVIIAYRDTFHSSHISLFTPDLPRYIYIRL